MGFNFSYVIGFDANKVENVLQSLISAVDEESGEGLRLIIPWRAAVSFSKRIATSEQVGSARLGFTGMGKALHCYGNHLCLALKIPFSRILQNDFNKHDFRLDNDSEFVSLGCVWTTINVGEEYGFLSLTAATSAMSRLFYESSALRCFVRDKFLHASRCILLDVEQDYFYMHFPRFAKIEIADLEEMYFEDSQELSADLLMKRLLAEAR
ncbi:hypothetical protein [Parachitinimonas caeni]|uniref:Uncharacterized protein n=1 Tax=Parachitinimonas caeni TaxID=3031301 RepID=A0ABT7E1D3_9NEIS|nr:hypothetical protein [Parachitinimonas caeni]MDK2125138.1 hypothetical protein [Parachitinimonas caeni]